MEILALAVLKAAHEHESSFDKKGAQEALDTVPRLRGGDFHAFYRVSLHEACQKLEVSVRTPVYLLLNNSWNESIDWANSVIAQNEIELVPVFHLLPALPMYKKFVAVQTEDMNDDEHGYAYYEDGEWWESVTSHTLSCRKAVKGVIKWRTTTAAEKAWMEAQNKKADAARNKR